MFKFWKKKPETAPPTTPAAEQTPPATIPEPGPAPVLEPALPPPIASPEPPPLPAPLPTPVQHTVVVPEADTGWAPASAQPPEADPASSPPAAKPSWRERLSGSGFARGLGSLFHKHPKLDDDLLDELETTLLTADVGIETSTELVESLRKRMHKREFADAPALRVALREAMLKLLRPVAVPLDVSRHKPFVILTVGINGAGKTTTIGKLAYRFGSERRHVVLAAGDTFRAAAVAQLQTWGDRNHITVISQGQNADAASVIFDALQAARARQVDVLIADTAGRLHTQGGLMDELGKIARVLKKLDPEAPHEVLMVIDGTTGQNAINQVRQFKQVVGVTGLVVTKLDGTAKGGVVFALAREFALPVRYVGMGEGLADLQPFDVDAYVDGLLPANLGPG